MHYAWVALLAWLLWTMAAGLSVLQSGAGLAVVDNLSERMVLWTIIAGLIGALILNGWLFAVWAVYGWLPRWRGRTWVALLPALLLLVAEARKCVFEPPSPQRYFKHVFHANLPEGAKGFAIKHSVLADNGTHFGFSCPRAETEKLIHAMGLTADPNLGVSPPMLRVQTPLKHLAASELLQFSEPEPRRTFPYALVTDSQMIHVVLMYDPMFDRSEPGRK